MENMPRKKAPNGKTERVPPISVTPDELAEIDRRAEAARMTRAEYMRRRGLGESCSPTLKRVTVQG